MPKGRLLQRPKARRPRRSKEEIINRLIAAACEEFERNGYAGTKTAAIARRARVAEWLIFTHFGSKARLFHESVFRSLNRQFVSFCSTHFVEVDDAEGFRKETRQYILELQQFVERHSRMLVSLVFAQIYEGKNVEGLSQFGGLQDYFSQGAAMIAERMAGKPRIDPKLIVRVSFATIMASVIFREFLVPEGMTTKKELRAAICDFVMYGLNANATTF